MRLVTAAAARVRRRVPQSQSMHDAIRAQSARYFDWCGAGNQRVGAGGGAAGGGAGNGDPPAGGAAATPFGFFGFFGLSIFCAALGGGPAGWSSAATGLGSTVVQ